MKISVGCHSHAEGSEPTCLCLGQRRLHVSSILESHDQEDSRVYEVRVLDGRRFVVRRQIEQDRWELVAVYDREPQRAHPPRLKPVLTTVLLISYALAAKILRLATKLRGNAQHLPSGGATV